MKIENCQVCGNPIFGVDGMGINTDGSVNTDYCSDCYKKGQFITSDADQVHEEDSFMFPYAAISEAGIPILPGAMGVQSDPGLIGSTGFF